MATIFRWVEEDLSTVELDMLALSGGASTGFDLVGEPDFGAALRQPPFPDGSGELEPYTSMSVPLRAKHTSADGYKALLRSLAKKINEGGYIEYRADGASASEFMKIRPSSIAGALHGQARGLYQVVKLFQDPAGYPVQLWRDTNLFNAETTVVTAEEMTNTVGDQFVKADSTGTMRSPARIEIVIPEADAEVVQARLSIVETTESAVADLAALRAFELDTVGGGLSYGSNTASVTDTGSGGKYARTTYVDDGYFKMRWRLEITPTDPEDLEGEFNVYGIVRLEDGTEQTVALKWGVRDDVSLDHSNEPVTLDAQEATGEPWVGVKLGKVVFTPGSEMLILEGWSQLDSTFVGGETIEWDFILLMGLGGKTFTVSVPGFRGGDAAKERWFGGDLATPTQPAALEDGVIEEKSVLLGEDAGVGPLPNGGIVYPAGKVVFRAIGLMTQGAGTDRQKLGEFNVRNITADNNAATRDLNTQKNRVFTPFDKEIVVETDGTSAYQPQIIATANTDGFNFITVEEIRKKFILTLSDGDMFVIDPNDPDQTGIWRDGAKISDLYPEGGLPSLEPDDNLITAQVFDWSGATYQNDVDEREPLAKVVHDREFELTVKYRPNHPL